MQKELDQVKERLDMMNNEFSSASDDKVSLLEQVGELKKRITSLQLERDTAVRSRTNEVGHDADYLSQKLIYVYDCSVPCFKHFAVLVQGRLVTCPSKY